MAVLALVGIIYFFVGAIICLLICVNPNDPGILGRTLPKVFTSVVRKIFGQRVLNFLGKVKYYLAQTNHPLVQWFYFLIAVGGFFGYAIQGIFKHMPSETITQPFVVIAYTLAAVCFWVYYKACSVSPGEVSEENEADYAKKYETYYDGIMYKKNNKCTTCNWIKPARSKHCSICRSCVSKFDHHCIWIRQCVGQKNYKYFVSFLFLHSIWCSYLSVIGTIALYEHLLKMKFWQTTFRVGGSLVKGSNLLAFQFVFVSETLFFFLIVMCGIMGITLFIFVSYHFFLIAADQTTNERVKRSDYIEYLKRELKDVRKFEESKKELPKKFEYKGEKIDRKEFFQIKDDMAIRLQLLSKERPNKGFFHNLKVIFSQKDY